MPKPEFLWAVTEQLRILDNDDALLILAVQKGRPGVDAVKRFLENYGLWRWLGMRKNPARLKHFIDVAEKHFRPRPATLPRATGAWCDAVTKFAARDSKQGNYYSAFLKIYWFYHPHVLTMYDTQVRRGLRVTEGELGIQTKDGPVRPENFLYRFDAIFKRLSPDIRDAVRAFNRIYPYERRVLDKYLWLRGTGNENRLIDAFKASLRLTPLRPLTRRRFGGT